VVLENHGVFKWNRGKTDEMGIGKRTDMGKTFDPEKYEMMFCPVCKGKGKLLNSGDGFVVCEKCGGFGMVKKENGVFQGDGK